MKKFLIMLCVVVFSLLSIFNCAFAKNKSNRFGIGGRVLYYVPRDTLVDWSDMKIEKNTALGLNLTYIITPHFSIALDWDHFESDIEASKVVQGFSGESVYDGHTGEVTVSPLAFITQYRILRKGPIIPYLGFGGAYLINDLDASDKAATAAEEYLLSYGYIVDVEINYELDNSWGVLANAGTDWFLTDNFALNFDAKYLWSEADYKGELKYDGIPVDTATDKMDLEFLILGFGIKYKF